MTRLPMVRLFPRAAIALLCVLLLAVPSWGAGTAGVKLVQRAGKWQLLRNGKPYFIKGGGGGGPKDVLAECGGNSFRTWGVNGSTQEQLDQAQRLGLSVTLGYWLGHKNQGFNYENAAAVQRQFDAVQRAVVRFKDHPAVLIWALGNEMEMNDNSPAMWQAIEDLAKMVHETDPHHPTMTVIAELGKDKIQKINQYCPDIDIIGINSYGGGLSLANRYRQAGGTKPYIVTEYGPPGTWEIKKNEFGAAPELTSTEKADFYRATYLKSVLAAPDLCLGSYAFTWGFKIEATSTWFGLFLPDGSRLAGVDALQELWSGKPPAVPCPAIKSLTLQGNDAVSGGEKVRASVAVAADKRAPVKIDWELFREQSTYDVQGTGTAAAPSFPEAIAANGKATVVVKMPAEGGIYRLYCYIRNAKGERR